MTERQLPEGWRQVALIDLLDSLETGSRPTGGSITSGIPSLSAEHMTPFGYFDFTQMRYIPKEFYAAMPQGHIRQEDILIVKDGATTGKVCLVRDDFPFTDAAVNEHVFLCRPNTEIVAPKYLFWWLWSEDGQKAITLGYRGAAIGGINRAFANNVMIPLAPLSEQLRIANLIEAQMIEITAARAAAEAELAAAEELAAAYLREVFESDEARNWNWEYLSDYVDFLLARSIASEGDAEVRAITTACLTETGFNPKGIKLARMWAEDAPLCAVKAGEVLIARSNTPELVGRVSIFEGEPPGVVASDLTIRMATRPGLRPEFLNFYLSFLYLTGYWKDRAGGASGTMKKITRAQLAAESIPVPPLDIQDVYVSRIQEHMRQTFCIRSLLEDQISRLADLPNSILEQAFNGEL